MNVPARGSDTDSTVEFEGPSAIVTSHETRPGKLVFTERDNVDGWIATDVSVELLR